MARHQFAGAAPTVHLSGLINSGALSAAATESCSAYPDGSIGSFVIVIDRGLPSEEKVLCSARTGSTFTITTRGYDGTSATSHALGAPVDHVIDATVIDNHDAHMWDTTRDDHTQYLKTTGSRATTGAMSFGGKITVTSGGFQVTGGATVSTGGLTVTAGGLTVTAGGAAITGNSSVTGTLTTSSGLTVSSGGISVTGSSTLGTTSTGALTPSSILGAPASTLGAVTATTVTGTGAVKAQGTSHQFGRGANSGTGQAVQLSEDGINTFVGAIGSTSNIALILRQKGTGTIEHQTAAGDRLLQVDSVGHVIAGNGASSTPTISAVNATCFTGGSTPLGTDTAGRVQVQTAASPGAIAAGDVLMHVAFANAYGTTPSVVVNSSTGTGATQPAAMAANVTTSGFDIVAGNGWSAPANQLVQWAWIAIGF